MSNVTAIASFTPRTITLPGDLPTLCRQYLQHLQSRRYSAHTVQAYRVDLEQFAGYCAQRDVTLIQHVTAGLLDDFVMALLQGNGSSARTASRKLETVRGLFRFAVGRQIVSTNPAAEVTPPKWFARRVIAPDEEKILAMIAAIPADTPAGIRDRALFRLMYDAGLRIGGLASLDLYEPACPPQHTVLPTGVVRYRAKGGRTEESCCDAETLALLDQWLMWRHRFERHDSPPALFLTERGTRLSRAMLDARIKLHGARVGMPHIHCHLLRHRRIGEVMDQGGLRLANYIAGHKQMSTTANVYGHQAAERLRHQVRSICPVGKGRGAGC